MSDRVTAARKLVYVLWMLAVAVPLNLTLVRLHRDRPHTIDAREKQAAYLRAPAGWNLLFLGDSRTYTDFDPDRLDPLLGTRSLNLAYWAHWFPTQYASDRDLIPHIPPGTVVVWSIGEQNFRAPNPAAVNATYPIRPWLLPRYVGWGYALTDLQDNVAGGLLDAIPTHALRDPLRRYLAARTGTLGSGAAVDVDAGGAQAPGAEPATPAPTMPGLAEYQRRRLAYLADPEVARVRAWIDEGRVTSIEVTTRRGLYLRDEIDTTYFRRKQAQLAAGSLPMKGPWTADPCYWNTFLGILDEFQRHHVRLVVNRVEEAPYHYAVGENRRYVDEFMDHVRHEVEARGFSWISVDWSRFSDADYFDYNHLNRRGVERLTPLFASALAPHLR